MVTQDEVNIFLDDLRDSGRCNMIMDSGIEVRHEFPGISRQETTDMVAKWMDTFEERHPKD